MSNSINKEIYNFLILLNMKLTDLTEIVSRIDERQRKMELEFTNHQTQTSLLLKQILEQTTATNGKVISNTGEINTLNKWKSRQGGIWYAVVIGTGVIAFLLGLALKI